MWLSESRNCFIYFWKYPRPSRKRLPFLKNQLARANGLETMKYAGRTKISQLSSPTGRIRSLKTTTSQWLAYAFILGFNKMTSKIDRVRKTNGHHDLIFTLYLYCRCRIITFTENKTVLNLNPNAIHTFNANPSTIPIHIYRPVYTSLTHFPFTKSIFLGCFFL